LRAPVSGVIAELGARQGMTVTTGTTLFRIAGLGTVWVVAEVPEAQAGMLTFGSRAEVRVPAYPDQKFWGRVTAILPEINTTARTVRARIEAPNPGGRLKPGMFANLELTASGARDGLIIPGEAVIYTGERNVVILAEGDGRFRPVEVEVGMEAGADTEIRKGLKEGDRVVVSGQFLIDSEASLRSALSRLDSSPATRPEAPGASHKGRGKITAVDAARGRVELDHEPMPSMRWPAMKMGFAVTDADALSKLKTGDTVEFRLRAEPDKSGDYVIDSIAPAKGPR
jgi:Cu(I)/Ag(I) efflux system membrane fusion protein